MKVSKVAMAILLISGGMYGMDGQLQKRVEGLKSLSGTLTPEELAKLLACSSAAAEVTATNAEEKQEIEDALMEDMEGLKSPTNTPIHATQKPAQNK